MSKPQRFEIGQAITLNTKKWHYYGGNGELPLSFGEIYHVAEYKRYIVLDDTWAISLKERPDGYTWDQDLFDPVITTNELEYVLEALTVEETV